MYIDNLFKRTDNDYSVHNPLTEKIKGTYPLIYDIAVYIAREFETGHQIHMTKDEITYIALHIGRFFEENVQNKNKITCIFVYADYYGSHKVIIDKLQEIFTGYLAVKYTIPADQYDSEIIVNNS